MTLNSRFAALDASLFCIETQTSLLDRYSLLRIQNLVRRLQGRYSYLEIGSHLGGTLLPHLLDQNCMSVHSVDPRPQRQSDERGLDFEYSENSTARMIEQLSNVKPSLSLQRLVIWENDAANIPPHSYGRQFDLVFIDGEHTNIAAFSDFVSVLPTLTRDALVVFHDANLVIDAINNAERLLRHLGVRFETLILPDSVAVIGIRSTAKMAADELGPHALDRVSFEQFSRDTLKSNIVKNLTLSKS
jgi:hypothetical protein